jgi:hypothetical protein
MFTFSWRRFVFAFVVALVAIVIYNLLTAQEASATESTDPPTYRIGLWTCQAVESDPMRNPCVLDPDPASDPVAVEPDNSPIPASEVYASIVPDADAAMEDEPGFDCRTQGNGVCGPGSVNPAPGCYNRNTGAFIAPWRAEWYGTWRPAECGRPTAKDRAQQARLNGEVGQLCAGTESGTGRVCWYVDQTRPKVADGPAEYVPAV